MNQTKLEEIRKEVFESTGRNAEIWQLRELLDHIRGLEDTIARQELQIERGNERIKRIVHKATQVEFLFECKFIHQEQILKDKIQELLNEIRHQI